MKRRNKPHEKKRKGLGLKPLMIGMTACTVVMGGVLIWAVLGSIHLESESGHGLGIVDAVNNMELQKKSEEFASKPSITASKSQTLTANESDLEQENRTLADKDTELSEETSVADEESAQSTDETDTQKNESVYQTINEATMKNPDSGVVDVTALTSISSDEVRSWIENYTYGEWPYLDGVQVTQADQDEILSRRNLDGIADEINISYGVITKNAAVRSFPTWKKASKSLEENAFDYFQESMLLVGEPVAIVHQTQDGNWSFVQSNNYRGWVETDHIGICSLDELKDWQSSDRAVVTDAKLILSDTTLRMGTSLAAREDADGSMTVSLPQREENGQLTYQEVTTAQDGIHFGYLELTQENVLEQAKKLIGTAYGWGDSNGDMDCSSTMNSIYRCFGILLPRNTSALAQTGTDVVSLENMTQEEKLEKIHEMKPGTLLVMKGHVVMYIGQQDGEDQILHNFTTCLAEDGVSTKEVYQCQITPLNLVTASGVQYLDAYATAISFPTE